MKKIIALLLIIGCFVSVLSVSVNAAEVKNEVDFVLNSDGEKISVDIKTNFECGSLQGALLFDDEKFEYSNISFADAIASKNKAIDSIKKVDGANKFAFIGDVNNGTKGEWATISYNGINPVFDVSSVKAYNASGAKVDAKVYVVFRGDANIDGKLDILDLIAFKNISLNTREIKETYKKNMDFDSNGSWEPAIDMTSYKKYLFAAY